MRADFHDVFVQLCGQTTGTYRYIYVHVFIDTSRDVSIFLSGSPVQSETPENLGTGTSKPGVTDDGQGGTRAIIYMYIYISSGLRKFRVLPNFLRPATVGPDADLHVGAFVEQQLANALSDPVAQHQLVVGFLLAAPAKAGYLYNDVCTQGVQNVLYIYT